MGVRRGVIIIKEVHEAPGAQETHVLPGGLQRSSSSLGNLPNFHLSEDKVERFNGKNGMN